MAQNITIQDFCFSPDNLTVSIGATVIWTNNGPSNHSAVSNNGSFTSENLSCGQQFFWTFNETGSFLYHCGFSPSMTGVVVVIPAAKNNSPYPPRKTYPKNDAINVSINVTLRWRGQDPDNDSLTYDVYFGSHCPLQLVSRNQSRTIWHVDSLQYNTTYYWRIYAYDQQNKTNGPVWRFVTMKSANDPPLNVPSNPYPPNKSTVSTQFVQLSWDGGDSDSEKATVYNVYFGQTIPPPIVSQRQNMTMFDTDILTDNETYYWQICIIDSHNATSYSPIWEFVTRTSMNHPPDQPDMPSPTDNEIDFPTILDLSWDGSDSDIGDSVTYDVYFGNDDQPEKLYTGLTDSFCYDLQLNENTQYYWQIVAWDNHGASTTGPLWIFVTQKAENDSGENNQNDEMFDDLDNSTAELENGTPVADSSAGQPYEGTVCSEIFFDASMSYDANGDIVSWTWDFGDGTVGEGEFIGHIYNKSGMFNVSLKVTDAEGKADSDLTTVRVERDNHPPVASILSGPHSGHTNTDYYYSIVTEDFNNDTIRYLIEWGDRESQTSAFTANEQILQTKHRWTTPGIYSITVAAQNETDASSPSTFFRVFIDECFVSNIGFLIDTNGNDLFDKFHSNRTRNESMVVERGGSYLIDENGDNTFEYLYDPASGSLIMYIPEPRNTVPLLEIGVLLVEMVILFLTAVFFAREERKNIK